MVNTHHAVSQCPVKPVKGTADNSGTQMSYTKRFGNIGRGIINNYCMVMLFLFPITGTDIDYLR
jgi:hypothetical protein